MSTNANLVPYILFFGVGRSGLGANGSFAPEPLGRMGLQSVVNKSWTRGQNPRKQADKFDHMNFKYDLISGNCFIFSFLDS